MPESRTKNYQSVLQQLNKIIWTAPQTYNHLQAETRRNIHCLANPLSVFSSIVFSMLKSDLSKKKKKNAHTVNEYLLT